MFSNIINKIYLLLLSDNRKSQFERFIFLTATLFFIVHFSFISLVYTGIIPEYYYHHSGIIPDPISTIYTPFTIILLYEIYLLIYYLPRSITNYLGKQYEIVALILIRGIFDYLAGLSLVTQNFESRALKNLLYLFAGFIILLLLIFCFYKLDKIHGSQSRDSAVESKAYKQYILIKKVLALGLFALFVFLFVRSFFELPDIYSLTVKDVVFMIKKMNNSFFSIFFSALILTEVLLLLFMYNIADGFNKMVRNSGFIISTILLKLSFKVEGLTSLFIILIAVAFGVMILGIYKLFERKL